jgi:hypothetical protein
MGPEGMGPVEPGTDRKAERGCADGTPLRSIDTGPWGGAVFVGEEGRIEIDRNKFTSDPPEIVAGLREEVGGADREGSALPGWGSRPLSSSGDETDPIREGFTAPSAPIRIIRCGARPPSLRLSLLLRQEGLQGPSHQGGLGPLLLAGDRRQLLQELLGEAEGGRFLGLLVVFLLHGTPSVLAPGTPGHTSV